MWIEQCEVAKNGKIIRDSVNDFRSAQEPLRLLLFTFWFPLFFFFFCCFLSFHRCNHLFFTFSFFRLSRPAVVMFESHLRRIAFHINHSHTCEQRKINAIIKPEIENDDFYCLLDLNDRNGKWTILLLWNKYKMFFRISLCSSSVAFIEPATTSKSIEKKCRVNGRECVSISTAKWNECAHVVAIALTFHANHDPLSCFKCVAIFYKWQQQHQWSTSDL